MSQQAFASATSLTWVTSSAYTIGARYYPIMNARDGFALHSEYSWIKQTGTAPVTGRNLTSGTPILRI